MSDVYDTWSIWVREFAMIHHVSKSHAKNGGAIIEMLTSCKHDMKEFGGNKLGFKAWNSLHFDKNSSDCFHLFMLFSLVQANCCHLQVTSI